MKILSLDTETSGFANFKAPPEHESQPDIVQLAAMLCEEKPEGGYIKRASLDFVVIPNKAVSAGAAATHGIGPQTIKDYGVAPDVALRAFQSLLERADIVIAFNLPFDAMVLRTAWHRTFGEDLRNLLGGKRAACVMKMATPICKIRHPNTRSQNQYKWPKLGEAYQYFFNLPLDGAHDALVDTRACADIYFEIQRRKNLNEKIDKS